MIVNINTLTPLRIMPKTIEAACYNHVRLALLRLGKPLRVPIPDHRGLEIILNDKLWVCVDTTNDDQPILAWLDFDTTLHNQALHEPVPCQLRLYHTQAGLVMGSVIDSLLQALVQRLAQDVAPPEQSE